MPLFCLALALSLSRSLALSLSRSLALSLSRSLALPLSLAAATLHGGCSGTGANASGTDNATVDASSGIDPVLFDSGATISNDCNRGSANAAGCTCSPGEVHACYTGAIGTRNVGACKNGMQACEKSGEFYHFGACTGDGRPSGESGHCHDGVDNDCNGATDCSDPACASDIGCANGSAKDGGAAGGASGDGRPAGSIGGGTGQKDGGSGASVSVALDAGYAVPTTCVAAGDRQCPVGTVRARGEMCCPCTVDECGLPTCCASQVCQTSAICASCAGSPLPAACNGLVDFDCDDFPEDCDQPCCPCKPEALCQGTK